MWNSAHLLPLLRIDCPWLVSVSATGVARVESGSRRQIFVRKQNSLRNAPCDGCRRSARAHAIGGRMKDQTWQARSLSPFGLEILAAATAASLEEIPTPTLKDWIAKN